MKKVSVLLGAGAAGLLMTACGSNNATMMDAAETFMEGTVEGDIEQVDEVNVSDEWHYPADHIISMANERNMIGLSEDDYTLDEISGEGVIVQFEEEEIEPWYLKMQKRDDGFYFYELGNHGERNAAISSLEDEADNGTAEAQELNNENEDVYEEETNFHELADENEEDIDEGGEAEEDPGPDNNFGYDVPHNDRSIHDIDGDIYTLHFDNETYIGEVNADIDRHGEGKIYDGHPVTDEEKEETLYREGTFENDLPTEGIVYYSRERHDMNHREEWDSEMLYEGTMDGWDLTGEGKKYFDIHDWLSFEGPIYKGTYDRSENTKVYGYSECEYEPETGVSSNSDKCYGLAYEGEMEFPEEVEQLEKSAYRDGHGVSYHIDTGDLVDSYSASDSDATYFELENHQKWYEGTWKDGLRHGKGTSYYKDGTVEFEGTWKNGEYHGEGLLYHENGQLRYEGFFREGSFHLEGNNYLEDGEVRHEGVFETGTRQSKVYMDYNAAKILLYIENVPDYESKMIDKFSLEGWEIDYDAAEIELNAPNNKEDFFTWNGLKPEVMDYVTYADDFEDEEAPSGDVEAMYGSTTVYSGDMVEGKREGEGRLYHETPEGETGVRYKGEWKNDKADGQGELFTRQHFVTEYEGAFQNGEYHGEGTLYEARFCDENQSFYEGELEEMDTEEYQNVCSFVVYEGSFENGEPDGSGTHYDEPEQITIIEESNAPINNRWYELEKGSVQN